MKTISKVPTMGGHPKGVTPIYSHLNFNKIKVSTDRVDLHKGVTSVTTIVVVTEGFLVNIKWVRVQTLVVEVAEVGGRRRKTIEEEVDVEGDKTSISWSTYLLYVKAHQKSSFFPKKYT